MKNILLTIATVTIMISCTTNPKQDSQYSFIREDVLKQTINNLISEHPDCSPERIEKGVRHTALLWWTKDGSKDDFAAFCKNNFASDDNLRNNLFLKISKHTETLYGHFNWMSLKLQEPVHLKFGELLPIDEMFNSYSPGAHLQNDLFDNKIAFIITLNFPYYSLSEKETLGKNWSRKEWAYARVGDLFTSRVPTELIQNYAKINSDADIYISQYNIHAGKLVNENGIRLFPEDMVLLSHWNLRDEIKANYPLDVAGLEKQKLIYRVMKHIIEQTIPESVINNPNQIWSPYLNIVSENDQPVEVKPEPDTRYRKMLDNFRALKAMDDYHSLDTYIKRNFEGDMEIAQPEVEELFIKFLKSDVLKSIGELISHRLGRELEPFDIWYDGFKTRSTINEDFLSEKTRNLYPDAPALEKDLANMLVKLGFTPQRAKEICDNIVVDPARGSGHAWGAATKGMKSHLRTRIPDNGLDYKGYNIAIHEFGHNVEQTISLYNMDYYAMASVPNTAFTEALAFIFQKRDLQLLGIKDNNPQNETLRTLDLLWSSYEIMGVSLLDMRVWKWLYENPEANETQLKETVIRLAKEIWNDYYAPVFGKTDEPILAVYSHMISYPLYLSAYAFGNIIEFQIEEHLKSNNFAETVDRIYRLGKLTPNHWMQQSIGSGLDIEPMLNAGREAVSAIKN